MRGRKTENERNIELFADWLSTPEDERLIKTQKEFARSIGVDEHTLIRWKAELADTDSEDEITKFRGHVYRQAMKSGASAKHMELYAKLKGLFNSSDATRETSEFTADDYAKAHIAVERLARKKLLDEGYGGAYEREEIIGILEFAKKEGIIDGYRELPKDDKRWDVFPGDREVSHAILLAAQKQYNMPLI
ncbi:hypothetical protein ACFLS8_03355 [Chloroflexota bacterium]